MMTMSAGKLATNDTKVVLSGYLNQTAQTDLQILTSNGWNESWISHDLLKDIQAYDHFITKEGLLFVSGGKNPFNQKDVKNEALSYNFTSMEWMTLTSMKFSRYFHKCQSIARDSTKIRFFN